MYLKSQGLCVAENQIFYQSRADPGRACGGGAWKQWWRSKLRIAKTLLLLKEKEINWAFAQRET